MNNKMVYLERMRDKGKKERREKENRCREKRCNIGL